MTTRENLLTGSSALLEAPIPARAPDSHPGVTHDQPRAPEPRLGHGGGGNVDGGDRDRGDGGGSGPLCPRCGYYTVGRYPLFYEDDGTGDLRDLRDRSDLGLEHLSRQASQWLSA